MIIIVATETLLKDFRPYGLHCSSQYHYVLRLTNNCHDPQGYYCHTRKLISFYGGKNENQQTFEGHQFTVERSLVVKLSVRSLALLLQDDETEHTTMRQNTLQ
jgi:hypothetical protein